MDQFAARHARRWLFAILFLGWGIGWALAQSPKAPAPSPTPKAAPSPATAEPAAPKLETPERPDKVVLKVGAQQFTKADIDSLIQNLPPQAQRALASQGKKSLGDQYALMIMLSLQAQAQHLDQSPAFLQRLAFQKTQLEAQAAVEALNQQTKITPADLEQYYTAHAAEYDEITVRQVVVRKKPAEPKAGPGQPAASPAEGFTPEEAKTRAEAIRKELSAGTDVKTILGESKPGDVVIDSEPRKIRRGGMRPEMEKIAFELKDGQISDFVDVPQAVVFFQVISHSREQLKDVTPDIEKSLRQQKVEEALTEVKKNNPIWMDDEYFAGPSRAQAAPTLGAPTTKVPAKP